MKQYIFALSTSIALLTPVAFSAETAENQEIRFTDQHSYTARELLSRLHDSHYHDIAINDQLAESLLDAYLASLDPSRTLFLESDIQAYNKYRTQLDDMILKGDLSAGEVIYRRFAEQAEQQLNYSLKLVANIESIDFTLNESLEIDRSEASWPSSQAEAQDLWRKRAKNAALSLKLAGKENADITKTLTRRYQNQLDSLAQQTSEDVFERFANTIAGMYDPHTNYYSPRTHENFKISMSLSLEGIGAQLQREDEFTKITRLIPGGPAKRQGELKASDRIIGVAQGTKGEMIDVIGWRLDEVVELIRGKAGSTVRLSVLASGVDDLSYAKEILIVRNKVKLEEQAAKAELMDLHDGHTAKRVGVISIPTFYQDYEALIKGDPNYKSTTRDVRNLIDELSKENIDGLVLDLRYNGGGSLLESRMLTDLFIDTGPVVQIRNSNDLISRKNRAINRAYYKGPLVVLINRLSASASEIFAGAIQDYGRGLVVGGQSFGKGTVQSIAPLTYGQLKLTESKFYRISGESTQNKGVMPDISLPSAYRTSDVGESAYDRALPWDSIHGVPHTRYENFTPLIQPLTRMHHDRLQENPDFVFFDKQIALINENNDRELISLNLETRKKEKARYESQLLTMENTRRKAKGKELYADYAAMQAANDDEDENAEAEQEAQASVAETVGTASEDDLLLQETGYILLDYINLSSRFKGKLALSESNR